MARLLLLMLCVHAVTSQGVILSLKTTPATPPTTPAANTSQVNNTTALPSEEDSIKDRIGSGSPTLSSNEVTQRTYEMASDAVYSVATRLHHLVDPTGTKNYLVSPLSVALLTGQMLLAARGDSERRLRALLTSLRPPRATPSSSTPVLFNKQQNSDLELHTQLGGLLKHLQSQGQTEDAGYQLAAGNAFFMNYDLKLKSSFQQDLTSLYGSELVRLNFSGDPGRTLNTINQWGSNHTFGRIPTIFSTPLSRFTAVVLVNTVYFRSDWETPFDPDLTAGGVFRLNGTHQIRVQNMRGQFEQLNFVDHPALACRMIVLPYKSPDVNMYVILPNKNITDIKDFALKLTTSNITALIKASSPYTVTVVLPKMALKTTYSLKNPIMRYKPQPQSKNDRAPTNFSRGNRRNSSTTTTTTTPSSSTGTTRRAQTSTTRGYVPTTQRPNKPARPLGGRPNNSNNNNKPWFDLSGASADERFRVNDIIHQVSLDVSEQGTEAAAITTGSVDYSGDGKVFKADRPFVFFIRHEPSLVNLFYGVVMDPTNGDYD